MEKEFFEVYVLMENQEQCNRMQKLCIDNGLPNWYHKDAFNFDSKFNYNVFCDAFTKKFLIVSTNDLYDYKSKRQITETDFIELVNKHSLISKYKPISMKCNKKQFQSIYPKLDKFNLQVEQLASFDVFGYLSNNFDGKKLLVSNIHKNAKNRLDRMVFEKWDEETFLKCCGIDI